MQGFDYYRVQFISNNPGRIKEIAEFVDNMPPDSFFGSIGVLAKSNGIDLSQANVETWRALIDSTENTIS